ncbi:phenylacetate-CoA ligase [Chthoniobacter flavus]|uniref:phenylacetate--CoA ligase family protein n=1 Tax=Chthoniobacter flavus TaxID=191863 RepID=UPI00104C9D28|nr:AMP-binding protein [Chthoniobacter flavus]TCO93006.1 phenylacetate-CoA ligase [Chthoniobacter flavus]
MMPSPNDGNAKHPTSPDFAFPPVLGLLEAQIVSMYRQLESSQWWPADKLRRWQFEQAARLVGHARQHVPFYAETPGRLPSGVEGAIDENAWRSLPILTKEEVRAEIARLKSRWLPLDVKMRSDWTTGSSGQPLEVLTTSTSALLFRANKLRLLRWHGYDPRGKVCEIRRPFWEAGSLIHRMPYWERPFGNLFPTGQQVTMDIFSKIEAQVHFLETEAPQYLLTYPSNLRLLLRAFRGAGKRLPTLRLVRTMSERLEPDLRRECQDTLGVPLVDCYGAQEAGYIAIQCPEHDHYHIQSEMNLVEVLGEDGAPCQPGETGRVVITPLHALAMPLLRYELGDYAEVGEPCSCGRGLPVLRQIYGRKKETLTLPSGERRYSVFLSKVFDSLRAVIQYQVIQKSLTALEVRIVAERPLEKTESDQIIHGLAAQVGPEFEVRLVFVDRIPRLPGGKHMDFVSEVETPP